MCYTHTHTHTSTFLVKASICHVIAFTKKECHHFTASPLPFAKEEYSGNVNYNLISKSQFMWVINIHICLSSILKVFN